MTTVSPALKSVGENPGYSWRCEVATKLKLKPINKTPFWRFVQGVKVIQELIGWSVLARDEVCNNNDNNNEMNISRSLGQEPCSYVMTIRTATVEEYVPVVRASRVLIYRVRTMIYRDRSK